MHYFWQFRWKQLGYRTMFFSVIIRMSMFLWPWLVGNLSVSYSVLRLVREQDLSGKDLPCHLGPASSSAAAPPASPSQPLPWWPGLSGNLDRGISHKLHRIQERTMGTRNIRNEENLNCNFLCNLLCWNLLHNNSINILCYWIF